MVKRLIISSLLAISVIGIIPVSASATWKQDKYKHSYWVENGVKAKGWKEINGDWYYFKEDGSITNQWMEYNGNWYYFWTNGVMASNSWLKNNGMWYYFDGSGKLVQDSIIIGDKKYDFTTLTFIFSKYLTTGQNINIVGADNKNISDSQNTANNQVNQSSENKATSKN
ncbi:phage tail protein [Clostridium beijerinckii]|uniref:Autolysin n=1 Tax=Clostridium beijerinckii TaxID=1520 RepID=A0AAE5LPP1_CLOBE|nr:phage tail protein [Clostridium beijerinckii]NSB13947.1 hypothetical protein [Clostridium beijerinckii]OOM34717.1 autolysin [Clostridium beijerinckii]